MSSSELRPGELKKKGWGGGGEGEVEETLKPKQYARLSRELKMQNSNHLHYVKHVVQSTLQNM